MKTKRAFLVEPHRFEIRELDITPGNGEVMVKIASCGLCNWEQNHWNGYIGTFPQAIGHEWNGTVVEVGPGAKQFRVGDRVAFCPCGGSYPGFSEYTCVPETMLVKIADSIELKYAIGEPLKCILTVLRAARPEAGDYGVIQGCGPMGLWCIQGLKGNLLTGLIAIDIDDRKLEMARKYGATHTINSRTEDVVARLEEITRGHMADFVIEGTGIPKLLEAAIPYLRTGRGRLVLMSSHETAATPSFDFRPAVSRSCEIIVAHPGYSSGTMDDMRRAMEMQGNGVFKTEEMVSHTFRLEDIQTAFEQLEHKPKDWVKGIVLA